MDAILTCAGICHVSVSYLMFKLVQLTLDRLPIARRRMPQVARLMSLWPIHMKPTHSAHWKT